VLKDVGLGIIHGGGAPTASFVATKFDYQGADNTPLAAWLGGNATGLSAGGVGATLADGVFDFRGFIRVGAPGRLDINMSSDDGSMLWIGGKLVLDNDGGHPSPGANFLGSASFASAGFYPIEIAYFNSDLPGSDPSRHGAASLNIGVNGGVLGLSFLYTVPEPGVAGLLLLGVLGGCGILGRGVRREEPLR